MNPPQNGTGGRIVDLTIDGDVTGEIWANEIVNLTIDVGNDVEIHSDITGFVHAREIGAMIIDGSLNGPVVVTGSEAVTLTVGGNVNGNVDIPLLKYLEIGNLNTGARVTIEETEFGQLSDLRFWIHGSCDGDIAFGELSGLFALQDISGNITIDLLTGWLDSFGDFSQGAVVTIKDMRWDATLPPIVWLTNRGADIFAGTLNLPNGIPIESSAVYTKAPLKDCAVIDFLGSDLVGELGIEAPSVGEIRNINRIVDYARLLFQAPFGGSVEIESIEGEGSIVAQADFTGQINILGDMSGYITMHELLPLDCTPPEPPPVCPCPSASGILVGGVISGEIYIDDRFGGNICASNVPPGGPLPSNITVGSIAAGATLCGADITCLANSECVDTYSYTADLCDLNNCWFPCDGNGDPEDPTVCAPVAAARSYHVTQNNRYLTFDPNNYDNHVALEVELTDGPGALGVLGWVGAPDPGTGVSRIVDDAHYEPYWPGVILLADCGIVPGATYEIRATDDEISFSLPLTLSTVAIPTPDYWADVVGSVDSEGRWTDPNGVTNYMDVQAAILAYGGEWKGSDVSWLDVDPQCPDGVVNFNDILQIILAFTGAPYPFVDPDSVECADACPVRSTGNIEFRLLADNEVIDPDGQVVIDVHVETASDVGVYEMSLEVLGGTTGSLDLTGMIVNKARGDYIFGTSLVADKVDETGGRLGAAMSDGTGVDVTTGNDYLGTFTYTASSDASGVFEVKVRPVDRAFLSDSNVDPIGTSPGDSLFIGVDVECVIDETCDDDNECTDDACVVFVCQNTSNYCDDANDCTSDTCNVDVCEHSNESPGTPCEDGQFCTTPDTCNNKGVCIGGPNDPCLPTEICVEFLDVCNPES